MSDRDTLRSEMQELEMFARYACSRVADRQGKVGAEVPDSSGHFTSDYMLFGIQFMLQHPDIAQALMRGSPLSRNEKPRQTLNMKVFKHVKGHHFAWFFFSSLSCHEESGLAWSEVVKKFYGAIVVPHVAQSPGIMALAGLTPEEQELYCSGNVVLTEDEGIRFGKLLCRWSSDKKQDKFDVRSLCKITILSQDMQTLMHEVGQLGGRVGVLESNQTRLLGRQSETLELVGRMVSLQEKHEDDAIKTKEEVAEVRSEVVRGNKRMATWMEESDVHLREQLAARDAQVDFLFEFVGAKSPQQARPLGQVMAPGSPVCAAARPSQVPLLPNPFSLCTPVNKMSLLPQGGAFLPKVPSSEVPLTPAFSRVPVAPNPFSLCSPLASPAVQRSAAGSRVPHYATPLGCAKEHDQQVESSPAKRSKNF